MIIREHDGHKYQIYEVKEGKMIVATASFAGKTVKGIARLDPRDTYDFEKGVELAILRCDAKICERRIKRAKAKYRLLEKFERVVQEAKKVYYDKKKEVDLYMEDAEGRWNEAQYALENFLSTL